MDHPRRRQPETWSDSGFAYRTTHTRAQFRKRFAADTELGTCSAMNGAVHTTTAQQVLVGRIHNCIDLDSGDVTKAENEL